MSPDPKSPAQRRATAELAPDGGHLGYGLHEDDEDDDPPEDSDEDRCHAGDDGCGAFLIHGHVQWGAQEEEGGVLHPKYGEDQSKGPTGPYCG